MNRRLWIQLEARLLLVIAYTVAALMAGYVLWSVLEALMR